MRWLIVCFVLAASVASAQDRATVQENAPIVLLPDATRTPLRVAAPGTSLVVVAREGEWIRVQFQDPQFGLRTGYVQAKFVRLESERPLDLSVPRVVETAPAAQPQLPPATQPRPQLPAVAATPFDTHRRGFSFFGGIGYGGLTCESCNGDSVAGLSGGLYFGWNTSESGVHQLGIGTTGWTRSEDGITATLGTLDFRYKTYFTRRSNTFLQAGIGVASVSVEAIDEFGAGIIVGGGHDIRTGQNVSVTPYATIIGLGFESAGEGLGIFQLGVAITVH